MVKRLTPDKIRVGDRINGHEEGWLTVLSIDRGGSKYEPVIYVEVETAKGIKTLDCVKHPWGWSDEFEVVRLRESATNNIKYKKAGNTMVRRLHESEEDNEFEVTMNFLNSGSVKLIKVIDAYIKYIDDTSRGGGRTVDEEDITGNISKFYTNIHDLLLEIGDKFGFSYNIEDYFFTRESPNLINTSSFFNEDYELATDDEMEEYAAGRLTLYEGVLTLDVEILKYSTPTAQEMVSLGLRTL